MIRADFFADTGGDARSATLSPGRKAEGRHEATRKAQGSYRHDAAVALAQEAGFDVSKAAWLRYQATQTLELSDEELESVTRGKKCIPRLTKAMCSTNCIEEQPN